MCLILLLSLPNSKVSAATFSDVQLYENEIEYLVRNEIITGYLDGTFRPKEEVSRIHGVKMLLRAKRITDFTAPNPNFTDMSPGSYGYAEVAKAVQLGIISGKTNADGTKYFDPLGKLTRGQIAKIIVESMNYPLRGDSFFRDVPLENGYYHYISTLVAEGVTEGYDDQTYRPNSRVTRQHFAVFIARALDDRFKTTPKMISYKMNNRMDYYWEYKEQGKTYLSKTSYVGLENTGTEKWDVWEEKDATTNEVGSFLVREDEKGLYLGYPESYYNVELAYPLSKGLTFIDPISSETYQVSSITKEVTTRAGTFRNVVEVKSSDGWVYDYAPNTGLIKSVEKGVVYAELIKLTPRK